MKKLFIIIAGAIIIAGTLNAQTPWFITGNAGTNTSTNFIGTTDNKALKFRTNNAVRMTMTSGGKIGIGTASPLSRLHIKGSSDGSQFIIDAGSSQTNAQPIIRMRDASGIDLMHIHSDYPTNTFIGLNAGSNNDTVTLFLDGTNNTFIGSNAGASNTTASNNTAVGCGALQNNTTGWLNTAIGKDALRANTWGGINTAVGNSTLEYNTTGQGNTGCGFRVLNGNVTGQYNTGIGSQALFYNNGDRNSAFGYESLISNNTGAYNTAGGFHSMHQNTSGSINTAYGHYSLYSNTTGNWNTATGHQALYNNNGTANTADGLNALYSNTTGNNNTAVGKDAMFYSTAGSFNTIIGHVAGCNNGLNPSNFSSFGYNAGHLGNNSNTIEIGNASVSWIGGNPLWSTYSDRRIKDNIQNNVPGLEFITKLNPVTYKLNVHRENEICGIVDSNEWEGKYDIEKITQTGFLAQEVEQAAKECNYDFNGVQAPTGNAKLYSIQYASFVVPLVKAVQEQQEMIEELKSEITSLKADLKKSEIRNIQSQMLFQNSPNPFNAETEIKFQLPSEFSSAQLIIADANGRQVRKEDLKNSSSIIIKASELNAGTYSYSLIIDGVNVDTKQMILTK